MRTDKKARAIIKLTIELRTEARAFALRLTNLLRKDINREQQRGRIKRYRERKIANGLCLVGGCRRRLFTAKMCKRHRDAYNLYARNRIAKLKEAKKHGDG